MLLLWMQAHRLDKARAAHSFPAAHRTGVICTSACLPHRVDRRLMSLTIPPARLFAIPHIRTATKMLAMVALAA